MSFAVWYAHELSGLPGELLNSESATRPKTMGYCVTYGICCCMHPAFGRIVTLRILASRIMLHGALPYGLTESMRLYFVCNIVWVYSVHILA